MTRAAMFRVILAMAMLPNFTAYWWLLPRQMKVWRNADEVLWAQSIDRITSVQFEHVWRVMQSDVMHYFGVAPITERDFRIPFTFSGGTK